MKHRATDQTNTTDQSNITINQPKMLQPIDQTLSNIAQVINQALQLTNQTVHH